ncbi:proline dehydrogenase family protein [Agromyces sp. Marseille-Q5079]|uniref:proline dehydrogenase family protein n=1 Tax=Agromyces sp. Marseille-Q5079 TaxID=3439059 RepID=UPI003D9CABFC
MDEMPSRAEVAARMDTTIAAEMLRAWALDERAKAHVMSDPVLADMARRVAARYVAGEDIGAAELAVRRAVGRGHDGSIEFAGESIRDRAEAIAATEVFVSLAQHVGATEIPSTVSGDLSHIGLLVSSDLVRANALRIAEACEAVGTVFMISAEGSDRTDAVLDVYEWLSARTRSAGITLQARLHRSTADLDRLLTLPGRIRLVKGAFLEPSAVALGRDSGELSVRYQELAARILAAEHPLTLATHDEPLLRASLRQVDAAAVEVEMLMGLGDDLLDSLQAEGWATREYCIFGDEWWLYVLNRMAESPERVFRAIADLAPLTL